MRSVDTDGTTEVRSWTSSSDTIEPDQFTQIRGLTPSTGGDSVTLAVTINGFTQLVNVTTVDEPAQILEMPSSAAWFVAPANVPTATSRLTFSCWFKFSRSIPNNVKFFIQSSTGCDLITQSDGSLNATVEDGTGLSMLVNAEVAPSGTIQVGVGHRITFDVDHTAEEVHVTVDGVTTITTFTASGNGVLQSYRAVSFLAGTTGLTALPAGTQFGDLSVDYNGTLHKAISNDATTANANAWKAGAGSFGN